MTVELSEWLRLRRLLREAAEAAEGAEPPDPAFVDAPLVDATEAGTRATAPQLERAERERVIELGVTGFIVRFRGSNPVLLEAISRIAGWRPNPSGSHHVPCTLPAITSLLAFAEMYDFELTDGADAMVRQLIRDSYRTREWQRQANAAASRDREPPPARRARLVARRPGALEAWLRRSWRAVAVAAALVYLTGPRIDLVREAERRYLQPAPLGADASVNAVLRALSRCAAATVAPGATPPPGCDATVETRPQLTRVAVGLRNPRVRVFSWTSVDGARGFAVCDDAEPLDACWER